MRFQQVKALDSRAAFYYAYTLDSPGMIMNIPGVGSQYLMGFLDSDGNPYDGSKPAMVPAAVAPVLASGGRIYSFDD